jgi:ornithine cyclodeaminase/alanine dehydrogenase-like protein (mu-crystallin family)
VFALERAYVHDVDPAAARAFANEMSERTGVRVAPVSAVSEATRRSPIIVTCTTSRRGFLGPSDVTPGAFIAAVGADNPDKQELLPTLMAESAVFVDQLEQCAAIGELHHALDAGALTRAQVRADLGQVVTGGHPGRLSDEEIVVFDSTGTAIQDVAASVAIYARARERGLGTRITLG